MRSHLSCLYDELRGLHAEAVSGEPTGARHRSGFGVAPFAGRFNSQPAVVPQIAARPNSAPDKYENSTSAPYVIAATAAAIALATSA